MAVSKVVYGTTVLVDLTQDTVRADKLAAGTTAHDAAGNKITGILEVVSPKVHLDQGVMYAPATNAYYRVQTISDFRVNFNYYGGSGCEQIVYPITGLAPGCTYTLEFSETYNGGYINGNYWYGCGIMQESEYKSTTFPVNAGMPTFITWTTTSTGTQTASITFTAATSKAYWVWSMARCQDAVVHNITFNVKAQAAGISLQNKTVTQNGAYTADSGYDGLGVVTVNVPQNTPKLQDRGVRITENGTQTITPESGFNGLSSVSVTVDVATSSGGNFPNGTEWTQGDLCNMGLCSRILNANGAWVAASVNTGLWYSTDGKTWEKSNVGDASRFIDCANGLWAAATLNCGLYYSEDGKTWTQSNITSGGFRQVRNANGIWVATSDAGLYYSNDGKTWTQSNIISDSYSHIYNANGVWVAAGTNGLYYSNDGKTWTQSNITTTGLIDSLSQGNGVWVAGRYGSTPGLYYSHDGKTWTRSNITSGRFYSIHNANGVWVAAEANGLYYSYDGKTWMQSNIAITNFQNGASNGVYNANGVWVAAGTNGLYYSYDGETWTQSNFTSLSRCPYNANGVWVASCQQYTVYSVTWEPSA